LAKKIRRSLIIDDEESIRDGCQQILSRMGHEVVSSGDAEHGLKLALENHFDLILLDVRMPKIEGLEILRVLKKDYNVAAKVIIITGYGTIPLAVEAMRLGATNFLTKPFSATDLRAAVHESLDIIESPERGDVRSLLIGSSDYMKELKETIKRVAQTDSTVLITGESGTGKELVARIIHNLSRRSDKTFIPVDCSSLVHNLMESELFGHIKGSFSGATETREGRFQIADKGTLFLDEISNISLDIQAKLLRVIQEQEVIKSLNAYTWPGNIRELKNTIERLCVLCDHEEVNLSDILYYGQDTKAKAPVVDPFSGKMRLVDVEKEHIEKALRHFKYHMNKTAKFLGIDRKTLRAKIRAYGIETSLREDDSD
jgi:DNA-binding NtrC family response regulator